MKSNFFRFVLCLAILATSILTNAETVLAYNVLIGFNSTTKALETAEWIRSINPDVILFQEIARHDSESFARFAKLWGHDYAAVAKPYTDFSIALTSNRPFDLIETHTAGFHHGFVLAKIDGVYFMSIHCSPFDYQVRIRETNDYALRLKPLIENNEKIIMMGDFNNSSPLDQPKFDAWLQAKTPAQLEAYIKSRKKNLNEGKFDYTAVKQLLDAGLNDVFFTILKEQNINYNWRIDLALLSDNLVANVVEANNYFRSDRKFFRSLSDHYPVMLKFKDLGLKPLAQKPDFSLEAKTIKHTSTNDSNLKNGDFSQGLEHWNVTPNKSHAKIEDGKVTLTKPDEKTYTRIYQDFEVKPNQFLTLTFNQARSLGAFPNTLIYFQNPDGQWNERERLNYIVPWFPVGNDDGFFVFKTPSHAKMARLAFVINRNPSSITLDNVAIRPATQEEIDQLTPLELKPKLIPDGSVRQEFNAEVQDIEVQPKQPRKIIVQLPQNKQNATAKIVFFDKAKNHIRNSLIQLRLTQENKSFEEPIVTPHNAAFMRTVVF